MDITDREKEIKVMGSEGARSFKWRALKSSIGSGYLTVDSHFPLKVVSHFSSGCGSIRKIAIDFF